MEVDQGGSIYQCLPWITEYRPMLLPCCCFAMLCWSLFRFHAFISIFFMEPPVPNFQLVGFGVIFHIFFSIEHRPLKKMYIFPIASRVRDFHCSGQQCGSCIAGQGREVACEEWLLWKGSLFRGWGEHVFCWFFLKMIVLFFWRQKLSGCCNPGDED